MGEIKRQSIQNSIISYSGIAISFVSVLILQPLFLTPDELGLTRFLASSSVIAGVIFTLGLGSFTLRYFPSFRNHANGHNGYLRLLLLITTCSFLFFTALAFIFKKQLLSWFSNSPVITDHFIYLVPISFSFGFITVLTTYAIGLFRSSVPVFLNEIYLRVAVIGVILVYHFGFVDFENFVLLYMLCFVSQLAILFFYIMRVDTGVYYPINREFWRAQDRRSVLSFLMWAAPGSLATIALRQIDVTMLGSDLNPGFALKDVAIYTIGFTIALVIEAPYNAVSRIAESKLSDALHRKDHKMIENVYYRSVRVLMIIGAFLYMGVCVNIRQLLSFLPEKYEAGFVVVIIIGATSFINMATGINSPMIFYSDKFKKGTLLIFGLILTSLLLNFILIPFYGIMGAAIATGTSLLLFNVAKSFLTWYWFGLQPYGKYVIYVITAFTLALVVNYFLPSLSNRIADMLMRSTVVTVIYGSIILFSKALPEANSFIQKHTGIKI